MFPVYTKEELELAFGKPSEGPERPAKASVPKDGVDDNYGITAALNEAEKFSAVPRGIGERNKQLHTSCFKLGRLIGAGKLREETAYNIIWGACERNYNDHPKEEIHKVILSSLREGAKAPRTDVHKMEEMVEGKLEVRPAAIAERLNLITGKEAAEKMVSELEWRISMCSSPAPGPVYGLNNVLGGGIPAGGISLLLAPPGQGKSSLAIDWALSIAESGKPAIVLSLELGCLDAYARACTLRSRDLNWMAVRIGLHMDEFSGFMAKISELPLYVGDRTMAGNVSLIRSSILSVIKEHGVPPVVIIDYLQLLASPVNDSEIMAEMGRVSGAIREIARETMSNILCISSMNRASYSFTPEGKQEPDPGLVLRGAKNTGQLEYDAEVVMGITLVGKSEIGGKQMGWVCVAKNRSGGSIGNVPVRYDGLSGCFYDAEEDDIKKVHRAERISKMLEANAEIDNIVYNCVRDGMHRRYEDVRLSCGLGKTKVEMAMKRLAESGRIYQDDQTGFYKVNGG